MYTLIIVNADLVLAALKRSRMSCSWSQLNIGTIIFDLDLIVLTQFDLYFDLT